MWLLAQRPGKRETVHLGTAPNFPDLAHLGAQSQ